MEGVDCSILRKGLVPGDKLVYFISMTYGKIYCLQEALSAYRHIIKAGSSFSANWKYNFEEIDEWDLHLLAYAKETGKRSSIRCAENYHTRILLGAYHKGYCSKEKVKESFNHIEHKVLSIIAWAVALFRRDVLHKAVYYW